MVRRGRGRLIKVYSRHGLEESLSFEKPELIFMKFVLALVHHKADFYTNTDTLYVYILTLI